jgi:hypothetical protein
MREIIAPLNTGMMRQRPNKQRGVCALEGEQMCGLCDVPDHV